MDSKILGKVIKAYRMRADISQKVLAERAGLSESTVGAIERGERRLSDENLVKLCLGLGSTVEEIFGAGYHEHLAALHEIQSRMLGEQGQQEAAAPESRLDQASFEQLIESWTAQTKQILLSGLQLALSSGADSRFRTPPRPPAAEGSPDKPPRARVGRSRRRK
jgi:transcriptional regulator with XRE-family HTH domain